MRHQVKEGEPNKKLNDIFPKTVVAKPKPTTGRTRSLNHATVALPDKERWANLQKECIKNSLKPGELLIKQNREITGTSKYTVDQVTKFVNPIFGVEIPILSATGSNYAGTDALLKYEKLTK